jgi:hypothetical protein
MHNLSVRSIPVRARISFRMPATTYQKSSRGAQRLPGTKPVDIKIEKCSNPRKYIERRNRNPVAPKLHLAFADVESPGGASGADTSPFQGSVKACGKGASQAMVLTATLEVFDGLRTSIHLVSQESI